MKTVCAKHVYAYETDQGCPWCVTAPSTEKRLKPYSGYENLNVLMVFDMEGRWEARLSVDERGVSVLEAGVGLYEFSRDDGLSLVESFVLAVQEYRQKSWNDRKVFLVHNKTERRSPGEKNLSVYQTHQGFEVGITTHYRFFLSDLMMSVDHCNALNISHISKKTGDSFHRGLVEMVIKDLDLGLTLR